MIVVFIFYVLGTCIVVFQMQFVASGEMAGEFIDLCQPKNIQLIESNNYISNQRNICIFPMKSMSSNLRKSNRFVKL